MKEDTKLRSSEIAVFHTVYSNTFHDKSYKTTNKLIVGSKWFQTISKLSTRTATSAGQTEQTHGNLFGMIPRHYSRYEWFNEVTSAMIATVYQVTKASTISHLYNAMILIVIYKLKPREPERLPLPILLPLVLILTCLWNMRIPERHEVSWSDTTPEQILSKKRSGGCTSTDSYQQSFQGRSSSSSGGN